MKKFSKVAVAGLLTMSIMLAGCGAQNNQGTVNNEEKEFAEEQIVLKVGTNPTFEPFEYMDSNNNIIGFDIDLMNAIAEDQGLLVEFESLEFDALIMALQTGSIDIIASGMTINETRKKEVNFTEEYIQAGLTIAVAQNNETIKGEADLQGTTVAAQIGTTGASKSMELKDAGIVSEVRLLADVNLCMLDLQSGAVDAVINDAPVTAAYISAQPGNVKVVGEPLEAEGYGFAVAKENTELLEKLNAGLSNVIVNGTYNEINAKYFGAAE